MRALRVLLSGVLTLSPVVQIRAQILAPILYGTPVAVVTNLLVSPADITNGAWQIAGAGCSKSSATTYTSTAALCSLWQVVSVAASTSYTVSVSISATGASQGATLSLSTTGFSQLCHQDIPVLTGSLQLLTCTVSSGANTSVQFEIDTDNAVASVLTLSGATLHQ